MVPVSVTFSTRGRLQKDGKLQHYDRSTHRGELPRELGVEIRLTLAATRESNTQFIFGLVQTVIESAAGKRMKSDCIIAGLEPADHVGKIRLTIPGD